MPHDEDDNTCLTHTRQTLVKDSSGVLSPASRTSLE